MDLEVLPSRHPLVDDFRPHRIITLNGYDVEDIENAFDNTRGLCRPFTFLREMAHSRICVAEDMFSWKTHQKSIIMSIKEALDAAMIDEEALDRETGPAPIVIDPATFKCRGHYAAKRIHAAEDLCPWAKIKQDVSISCKVAVDRDDPAQQLFYFSALNYKNGTEFMRFLAIDGSVHLGDCIGEIAMQEDWMRPVAHPGLGRRRNNWFGTLEEDSIGLRVYGIKTSLTNSDLDRVKR
ncbi:hypothetical protein N657DRAFT_637996 [Parathielavia appendiculata]|uniref:Uncharacterized protein n=1 Tax=Parathielavia appendiculata TaxID=2587402 RepID=A0AAN6TR01_9PEZI|nr:hypothetical protein N657DRAFT_637996 [Parathielavia appendiculata]